MKTTIELCKTVGFPLMVFEGVPYVSPQLERLVALVRANERAAPVQEPVAYLCENAVGHKYFRWKKPSSEFKPIALYTTPPAAQRQWVGLTDEEVAKIVDEQTTDNQGYDIWCDGQGVARAIEAALRSKNT